MTRRLTYRLVALLLITLSVAPASSQTRIYGNKVHRYHHSSDRVNKMGIRSEYQEGVYHLIGAYFDGAYSSFVTGSTEFTNKPGGYGLGAGLIYGYQNGKLLIQTGVGVRYQLVKGIVADKINDPLYYYPRVRDTQGTEFDLRYNFTDRTDLARSLFLNIPVMAGGYLYRNWYALGGLKIGLLLAGSTEMSAIGTSFAQYDRYIGDIGQMDNHGYRKDVPLVRSGDKLNVNLDLQLSGEIGYEWHLKKKAIRVRSDLDRYDYRLRIAAFADFGLISINAGQSANLYGIPANTRYDFDTFTMTHVFNSANTESAALRNLFAGVRVTVFFFGYRTKDKCLMCEARGKQKYIW